MPRQQNFFYQGDPTAQIGSSLARAIFGDPEAAAKQQQLRAEMAERQARTRLLTGQAVGVEGQNTASASLPEVLARMAVPPAPSPDPIPSLDDPHFLDGAGPTPPTLPQPSADEVFRSNLPTLLATMGQMNGDKIDPTGIVSTLASFLGGDGMARRGMVAGGHTPGADFALTPERADEIAANGYAADERKALGVAQINNRDDIPVANIQAGASRDVARINHSNDLAVADIKAGNSRGMRNNNPGNLEYGAFTKRYGATGSDGRFAIFPDFESGRRAQEALLAGPTYLGGGVNTISGIINRYAPSSDGNSVQNYADFISQATGIPANRKLTQADIPAVAEAMRRFENGGTGGGKKAGGKPPAPKAINQSTDKFLFERLDAALEDRGSVLNGVSKRRLNTWAQHYYQQTGNMALAVEKALGHIEKHTVKSGSPPPSKASSGAPVIRTDAQADAFVNNPANKGKVFTGPDGQQYRVP